jgi:hypothetical protein
MNAACFHEVDIFRHDSNLSEPSLFTVSTMQGKYRFLCHFFSRRSKHGSRHVLNKKSVDRLGSRITGSG